MEFFRLVKKGDKELYICTMAPFVILIKPEGGLEEIDCFSFSPVSEAGEMAGGIE